MNDVVIGVFLILVIVVIANTLKTRRERREDELAATTSLDAQIMLYTSRGYRITHRDALNAQMIRPKQFSFIWSVAWFLVFGVGLVVYVLYYLSKKDEVVYFSWPATDPEPEYPMVIDARYAPLLPPPGSMYPPVPQPLSAPYARKISDGQ